MWHILRSGTIYSEKSEIVHFVYSRRFPNWTDTFARSNRIEISILVLDIERESHEKPNVQNWMQFCGNNVSNSQIYAEYKYEILHTPHVCRPWQVKSRTVSSATICSVHMPHSNLTYVCVMCTSIQSQSFRWKSLSIGSGFSRREFEPTTSKTFEAISVSLCSLNQRRYTYISQTAAALCKLLTGNGHSVYMLEVRACEVSHGWCDRARNSVCTIPV